MDAKENLKRKTQKLYKNVEYIYLYFEDVFEPGRKWIKDGNLMHLSSSKNLTVNYDQKVFREVV